MMLASFSHHSAQPAVGRYANTAPLLPEEHTFRNDAKMTPISGLYRALSCDSNSNGFQTTPVNGLLSSTPLAMEHLQVAHQAQLEPFKRPDDINASSAGVDLKKRNPFYDQAAYTKQSGGLKWLRWLLILLAIVIVVGLCSWALWMFSRRSNSTRDGQGPQALNPISTSTDALREGQIFTVACQNGFFASKGKCIKCSAGATWNGTNCLREVNTGTVTPLKEGKTKGPMPFGTTSVSELQAVNDRRPQDVVPAQTGPILTPNKEIAVRPKPSLYDGCPEGYLLVDGHCTQQRIGHLRKH